MSCNKPLVEAIISVLITLKAVNIFNHAASELFFTRQRGASVFEDRRYFVCEHVAATERHCHTPNRKPPNNLLNGGVNSAILYQLCWRLS
jgi:hypothetical protein